MCWEGSGEVGCVCWEGSGKCWEGGGECWVCVLGGWWRVRVCVSGG